MGHLNSPWFLSREGGAPGRCAGGGVLGSWGLPRSGSPGGHRAGSLTRVKGPGEPCVSGPGDPTERHLPTNHAVLHIPSKTKGPRAPRARAPGGGRPSSGTQRKPGSLAHPQGSNQCQECARGGGEAGGGAPGFGVQGGTTEHTHPAPQIDWDQPAEAIHNWIRGNDKVPGAWTEACGQVCPCGQDGHAPGPPAAKTAGRCELHGHQALADPSPSPLGPGGVGSTHTRPPGQAAALGSDFHPLVIKSSETTEVKTVKYLCAEHSQKRWFRAKRPQTMHGWLT